MTTSDDETIDSGNSDEGSQAKQKPNNESTDQNSPREVPARDDQDELPEVEPLTPELVEDEAIRGDFMLRWAVVLLAFLMACTEVADSRTLVHVKTGQYIASNGMLPPRTDVFSYTLADRPWINLSWLFDLISAGVYGLAGATGLTLMKAVIAAATFFVIVQISRREVSTWWGSIVAGLALLVCFSQFTALPELVTMLGIALMMWFLHRWREQGATGNLWGLGVMFLLWSNLDPRMFLGLVLLVLYALGQTIGRALGRGDLLDQSQVKKLWMTVGICFLAALINPFGWNSLLAPLTLYGTEYPALRALVGETVTSENLQYFSMTSGLFWSGVSYHTLAGLMVALAALVSLAFNWDEVDWGHVLLFFGFAGLAMLTSHELAPAVIVFAVITTLNAQSWYRRSFRQTYSVETTELLFSRGGRAATVFGFFLLAYLSMSGHLGGPETRRTGIGWHSSLRTAIDGIREEISNSYDNRPFNVLARQGDLLIWVDQAVFLDSRVALYYGPGEEDLLQLHFRTRQALRMPTLSQPEDRMDPKLYKQKIEENKAIWKETFDKYGLSHVLVDMSEANPQNYEMYLDLVQSSLDWQQEHLGAVTARFYRRDVQDPKLLDFLKEHRIDLIGKAFRTTIEDPVIRPEWARAKDFYDIYLSLPEAAKPNPIRQAEHFAMYLKLDEVGPTSPIRLSPDVGSAIAHLAIRSANQGLSENPQDADGYRALGIAYEFLLKLESEISALGGAVYDPQRRWYQALAAYQQALTIEPDHLATHQRLFRFFLSRRKMDLALREFEEHERLILKKRKPSEEDPKAREADIKFGENLRSNVSQMRQRVEQQLVQNPNRFAIASQLYQAGYVLLAREILENDAEYLNQNPQAQLLQAILLLEAGEAERAYLDLERLRGAMEQYGVTQWRIPSAMAILGNGNHLQAIELFSVAAKDSEKTRVTGLLKTMPLLGAPDSWPFQQIQSVADSMFRSRELAAKQLFEMALSHLEIGEPDTAIAAFQRIIATTPETTLRPLVRFYLMLSAQEIIDARPPSDRIPIAVDLFVDGFEVDEMPVNAAKPE